MGFTERPPSRADLASSYLAVSPLLRARGPGRSVLCGTFPRSPGAAVDGHPALRSPDFPPASSASGCSTSSGARRARRRCSLAGLLTFRLTVQHALAVRTQDHLLVALDLIVELRRHVHVAALTGAAAHRHDGDAAAPGEDHFVAASKLTVDALDQLVTTTPIALDLRAETPDG